MIRFRAAIAAIALFSLYTPAFAPAANVIGGVYPFAVGDKFTDQVSETQTETGSPPTKFAYVETTTIGALVAYGEVKAYPVDHRGDHEVDDVGYRNFVTSGGKTYYVLYGYNDDSMFVPRLGTAERGTTIGPKELRISSSSSRKRRAPGPSPLPRKNRS